MEQVSNDVIVENNVEPVETNLEPSKVTQTDSYESQAREQGWKPKEEYQGDPEKWKPAKEFVERGELFGKIDSMGKELKETRKALKMLQEHHSKVKETEFKNAINELKSLQKKHLEEGNSDGYLEATELLTDLKTEQKAREVVGQATPNQPDPRFLSWVGENKWYEKDADMRDYADTLGMGYAQRNPGIDPLDVLEFVTKQVKTHFKEKFVNPNRTKPSAVDGGNAAGTPAKSNFELSDEEKKVMNTFLRNNLMTKEEYMNEVKKLRNGVK